MMKISLLLSALLLLTSCEYKDLCYDHNHWSDVRVAFDWSAVAGRIAPRGMTALFYDTSLPSQEPVRYDLPGTDGGTARLQPGDYQAATYNYDTETILYRGMERAATLEAYTRQSSIEEGTQLASTRGSMPRAANTEQEPVILEPDPLCAAVCEPFALTQNESRTVTLTPEMRCHEVTVTILNVPNLQYAGQFGGALTGLAPSVNVQTGQLGEGCATQAFTAHVAGDSTLVMHFRIFGHCPQASQGVYNSHVLTVYAILADGSKWYYNTDVSLQLHDPAKSPDDYKVTIELHDLPVPKPIVNGSGFQPSVDGWQGIEIDVGM